ncbi:neuroligin-4, Y-linked-like isoform X2 [Dreissena polymorpha]|nr:neuroligin-4, Y-linked-like isoform X2 [Dreissena polymorpha]
MTGVNSYEAASYIVGVWPNILGITDFNNFSLPRETFTKTAVTYALQNLFGIKNNATVDVLRKLLSFAYIDWEHNGDLEVNTKALIDFTKDLTFFYPAILSLVGHLEIKAARASTYMYEFGVVPSSHSFLKSTWIKDPSRVIAVPIPTPKWVNGSNHADELRYVFGIPVYDTYRLDNTSPDDIQISKAIMTLWTNFAKTGNPNTPASAANFMPSQEDWSEFNIDSQQYMYMSNQEFSMRSHFRARRMALWGQLVSYIRRSSYVCDQCTGNQGLIVPPLSSVLFG